MTTIIEVACTMLGWTGLYKDKNYRAFPVWLQLHGLPPHWAKAANDGR